MTTTARPMLVRAGPGASAWTGLPERDRTLLLWLVQGDVVTAELAALVAYGHRRVAQRRLARLVEYGLLSGFWAANRQRPRGRHAYALTKVSRAQLERLVWPLGKPKLSEGAIETVSPVIHQLATHDLFAAFLRAADPEREIGLAGWVPERALVRLTDSGYLRADALAIVRNRDAMIVLFIERDLGTERCSVLVDKLRRYRNMYWSVKETNVLHVGIVVESQRRAHAVRLALRSSEAEMAKELRVWVTTEAELTADPHGAVWISPAVEAIRTIDLERHPFDEPWPILMPLCLATPDALEVLDERVVAAVPVLTGLR
ncbi:MAG TPA: replication-relaxation family protein [Candidatus Limnocylindrales bacterium]